MYSVLSYGQMAADGVRIDAYARAIAKTVKPGQVVVDLGSGTGIAALLALRAGARRVHAIDINPAVWLARDLGAENGAAERLVVHHGSSFEVDLPERADVVIADCRGSFPLYGKNLALLEDAKNRFLAPGGVMIPMRDRLFVALVETERHRANIMHGWSVFERQGFSAAAARNAILNCVYSDSDASVAANDVLSDAKVWSEIRYGEPFTKSVTGHVELTATRAGTAHALALWFEATLLDGIGYANAPGHQLVYSRTLLPLLEPVRVTAGDTAKVTLRTDVEGGQWAWDTTIGSGSRVRQATFFGTPTSPEALLRESVTATPSPSAKGARAARILALLDGTRTIDDVADAIASAEPELRRDSIADEVKECVRLFAK